MPYIVIKQRKHGHPLIYVTFWRDKARQRFERATNGYDDNRNGVYIFKGARVIEEWPWGSPV